MIDDLRFMRAIRMTESRGEACAVGDAGRAWTSVQCHPAWLAQWARDTDTWPTLGDTWDDWTCKVVQAFARKHSDTAPISLAMYYHLGHWSATCDFDWDADYAHRFEGWWAVFAAPQSQKDGPA